MERSPRELMTNEMTRVDESQRKRQDECKELVKGHISKILEYTVKPWEDIKGFQTLQPCHDCICILLNCLELLWRTYQSRGGVGGKSPVRRLLWSPFERLVSGSEKKRAKIGIEKMIWNGSLYTR